MIIRKACHEEIAMIVSRLHDDFHSFNTSFFHRILKILREQLPILIEVVTVSLEWKSCQPAAQTGSLPNRLCSSQSSYWAEIGHT